MIRLVRWSPILTPIFVVLGAIGYYLGSGLQLRLSLSDLLPENHPTVAKFDKLTEIVGGVGYFTIILHAEDGKSHLQLAPKLVEKLRQDPTVRSAFYHREQKFFADRLLYYIDTPELLSLEKNIDNAIIKAKRTVFDLGLWRDEAPVEKKEVFNEDMKKQAVHTAKISPYLTSIDGKDLLIMVKPNFDSMDLGTTKKLIASTEKVLAETLPANVTYKFAERYYAKVIETAMVESDIFLLGSLSIALIALIIFIYLRSFRGLVLIFVPVLLGMGITVGITRLFIGHINIITGFLMGIVSGLGVDYAIHLLLRLRQESTDPRAPAGSNAIARTLESSGHAVLVGAMAAAVSFLTLCFSSFRAFSEFGFICGVGIVSVLVCLLGSFAFLARWLKLDVPTTEQRERRNASAPVPILRSRRSYVIGIALTAGLVLLAGLVGFEYDFNKMMKHSHEMEARATLVDTIYGRSAVPSALSAPDKETALAVEKRIRKEYMPQLVGDMFSGASIVPEHQAEKFAILSRLHKKIAPLRDKWIEKSLGINGAVVRAWTNAKPFTFSDIPAHIQNSLRGTKQDGFLLYLYPSIKMSEAKGVRAYAAMVNDIEKHFPSVLAGSDAVVFSDILDLIDRDGLILLLVIFVVVGLFLWLNMRKWSDTLMSYLPLLLSLPVGMGLMAIFGVKFNIFNIAIIPTFVAMGIDVPIHIVHRSKETGSGFQAARDLAASVNLALLTAGVGFGVLIFARAGVLKSLGWIALLGTVAIWWTGMVVLPAVLERFLRRRESDDEATVAHAPSHAN